MKVFIQRLVPDARFPQYQTEGSAGADLFAAEDKVIDGGQRAIVGCGIALELPPGYEAQVRPRSGLAAKEGITVLNTPGTIDSDYRGEVKVILYNTSKSFFFVRKGDRIAQLVIAPVCRASFSESDILGNTERGEGGLGSTGV